MPPWPQQKAGETRRRLYTQRMAGLGRVLSSLRRHWRRIRRWWGSPDLWFVYHPDYDRAISGVPLDPMRADRILAYLSEEALASENAISLARAASLGNILRVHSETYVESLQRPETLARILGVAVSEAELEGILDLQRLMVGGTIQASRLAVMTGGVGVHLGGGFHHASRDQGMAFCVFNDVAVAIARLRARGFAERIMVVDLDLHDGNGTRAVFAADDSVYTYSVHNQHWGDTDAVASTAIALGEDVTDDVLLGSLRETLPELVERFRPGLAFFLAGVDSAADDRLGNWRLSAAGLLARDQLVLSLLRTDARPVPTVVVLAGGYGRSAWRYPARSLAWLASGGRVLEPPETDELVLRHFRQLRARLDPGALTSEPGDFSWRLTADDLVGMLPGIPRQTRFLRYFSRHGLELVLERFGLLRQLRARGYPNPELAIDLSHPLGQTLRIWSDPGHAELLVELRVGRNLRVVPGMEVMVVEWLLLQNPRAVFEGDHRPLPDQRHPGLGLLREFLGWLVMVCELLELDGIYYVPSHYHVAVQSRRLVRFLRPEHEARFRALAEVLADLPLGQATRAVEDGRVVDATSHEPVAWETYPMVLPVSERLREQVFSPQYEATVEAARQLLHLELRAARG